MLQTWQWVCYGFFNDTAIESCPGCPGAAMERARWSSDCVAVGQMIPCCSPWKKNWIHKMLHLMLGKCWFWKNFKLQRHVMISLLDSGVWYRLICYWFRWNHQSVYIFYVWTMTWDTHIPGIQIKSIYSSFEGVTGLSMDWPRWSWRAGSLEVPIFSGSNDGWRAARCCNVYIFMFLRRH